MNANANARRAGLIQRLTLAPYSVWAVLFIVVPLFFVAYYAFTDNSFNFTFDNVARFFTATSATDAGEVRTYIVIFLRSLKLAVISTLICLILGYPMAYIIARAEARAQKIMITLIMIPMWMNFLIRTYAWMTILQDTGILNGFLSALGLGRIHVIGTEAAVVIGMVYDYFPYMILPIYSIMAKMDTRLIEAARDLGCNSAGVLRRVIWPLSLPGVISGITMVFMPSVTTFFIPRVLGGGNTMMFGDLIESKFLTEGNWNVGSALSLVMMLLILISLSILRKADPKGEGGGMV